MMKVLPGRVVKYLSVFAMFYSVWFLPEVLYQDAVHVTGEKKEECTLTKEEYRKLFSLEESDYKISFILPEIIDCFLAK